MLENYVVDMSIRNITQWKSLRGRDERNLPPRRRRCRLSSRLFLFSHFDRRLEKVFVLSRSSFHDLS